MTAFAAPQTLAQLAALALLVAHGSPLCKRLPNAWCTRIPCPARCRLVQQPTLPPPLRAAAGSYPNTGKVGEVGTGAGEGATINVPLPGDSGEQGRQPARLPPGKGRCCPAAAARLPASTCVQPSPVGPFSSRQAVCLAAHEPTQGTLRRWRCTRRWWLQRPSASSQISLWCLPGGWPAGWCIVPGDWTFSGSACAVLESPLLSTGGLSDPCNLVLAPHC